MSPQEIEKLLGGYATDTLTEEERRTLFEAALGNQALFDALADEQALRELLLDPPSRAHLLAALGEERGTPAGRFKAWWRQPSVWALAAAAAGIVTIAVVIPRQAAIDRQSMVAMNKPPQPLPESRTSLTQTPAPKPAAQNAPANSRRAEAVKKERPERDATVARNAPATAVPPPRPSLPVVPPAATFAPPPPAEEAAVQTQSAANEVKPESSKLTDTMRPAGAVNTAMENRKDVGNVGARDLYYAMQPAGVSGFLGQPRAAKAAPESFSRGAPAVVGGVAEPVAGRAVGVRYSILRRTSDGSFMEVDPATIFAPGDALRVRLETNLAGSLGVMQRQSSGLWTLRMGARMQAGVPVYMPSESTITPAPGATRFFVRFSRSLRSEPNLGQITPTANLLRESAANSVYVVNPAWAPDAAVDFELTINVK